MAEKIQLKVDLEANLGKVIEATRGLKLDKGQTERLEKYSKGAQLALDSGDLKTFQKNFNSLMKLFQDAAAATGEVSDAIKDLTSKQSKLNQEINRLKDKKTSLEGKLTKDQSRLTAAAAREYASTNIDAGKVLTNKGIKATRDEIIELNNELAKFLESNGRKLASITNEELKGIKTQSGVSFANRNAAFAANRYVKAEQQYSAEVKTDLVNTTNQIETESDNYATLTEELNRMTSAAGEGAEGINALYTEIAKIASETNTKITEQINKEKLDKTDRTASSEGVTDIKNLEKQNSTLGKAFKQFTVYSLVIRAAKTAVREAVQTVKELDKYLTEQAMVTGKTREETYKLVGQYQELALRCGATTKEIAEVSTEYMKQGKSVEEALVLTEAAVKAAKVARVSVGDSVNYLTTALNGFRLEASQAMAVSDKFAAIAAASATDYDELAIALSKVASQANLAGMSIDYTTALLTKGLETTREAPETMGTALKTIIARMRELGDYGETLEDGTDINNVESQLAYVGIALRDQQGELRSTEDVLDELGKKWDTLNKNQQAAVAKALAGTRQQSRLIAMMEDYERVTELQQIAERSAGATSAQAGVYLEGMEAALNKIQVAWEKIVMTISDSEVIIGTFNFIGGILDGFGDLLQNDFFTGAGLVAVIGSLTTVLGIKLQEQHIARETAKIEQEKAKLEGELRLKNLQETKKAKLEELKANANILKSEIDKTAQEKQQLIYTKAQARLKENPSADLSDLMAESQKVAQETQSQKAEVDAQMNKSVADMEAYYNGQIKLQEEINFYTAEQGTLLGNAGNAWLGYANTISSMAKSIAGTIKNLSNASKKAAQHNRSNSASVIPVVGWVISLILEGAALASTIITIVGGIVNTISNWIKSISNNADSAAENINKLSNDIYKLNESANALNEVGRKFDELDDKVIKTKEDLAEMSSLLKSAGDNLSEENDKDKKGKEIENSSDKYDYSQLKSDTERRKFIEIKEQEYRDEANKKRQDQLDYAKKLSEGERKDLLDDSTTNSKYLETQSEIRAIANNEIYETINALREKGIYDEQELQNAKDVATAIMSEVKAMEAYEYALDPQKKIEKLVTSLNDLDATHIFMDESQTITERIKAYEELEIALQGDVAALKALHEAYADWKDLSKLPDGVVKFMETTKMSIDELNELYSGYKKLNKAGMEVTRDKYRKALNKALPQLDGDLGNLNEVVQNHFSQFIRDGKNFKEDWNTIISAIGDSFTTSALDMGQQMESFGNTINKFYETATKWSEMSESEKMEFKTDNAELFKAGGKNLLTAFESGNYADIEAAIGPALEKRRKQQLEEVRQTLAVEREHQGEDRDEVYIAELERYEEYLEDTTNLFKANLELQLEQQQKQLDEYRDMLEKEKEALTESLEKRKEAYEKYFDEISKEEEDAEYEEERDKLITNISKLASSGDADAKAKTMELEQELKELEAERLQTLKERAREAILENMDNEIEEINDKFDKLLDSNQALLATMQGDLANPTEFLAELIGNKFTDGATKLELEDYIGNLESIYGNTLDGVDWDAIKEEIIEQLFLNVNGQDVYLNESDQQSVFKAVKKALQEIGKR